MTGNNRLIVQPRDLRLLRKLSMLRVVGREQAKIVAGFGSTSRVNTRLLALTRAGLLRRFFLGSGGGRKALYALSSKGAEFAGVPCRGPRRRQGEMLTADYFIQHQLTINDIYCAVKYGTIPYPDVKFRQWLAFYEPLASGIDLIPDGYAEFTTPSGVIRAFLEIDLGHESLKVWREKIDNYIKLALREKESPQPGRGEFLVLVLANSARRIDSIRKTVAAVTRKIFRFAILDATQGTKFFGPVWLRPDSDRPKSLFDQTS